MKESTRNKLLRWVYPLIARVTRCSFVAKYPLLYFPYCRLFRRQNPPPVLPWSLPDANTDLVIEEAGACGNHSLAAYFKAHNPDRNVATLTHGAAPVRYAAKHGIPCIVLTRDIFGYVESTTTRMPHLYTQQLAVRVYTAFFLQIQDVLGNVLVVRLHELANPQRIIARLNHKYRTTYNEGDGDILHIRGLPTDVEGA